MMDRADRFSKKIIETPPSGIRRFFDLVSGSKDIISLGVGEPDFATPWCIREEAFYHLEQGHTSYTSNWGLLELREEISKYLFERYSLSYSPEDEVLITIGVSEAVDLVLRSILNPGDELIVAEPCYVSYQPLVAFADAKVVPLDTGKTGMVPRASEIEKLVTPNTKALMICTPSNPTGRVVPSDELERIAELAKKHNLWVISDEVYSELVYDGREHCSIGSLPGMKDYTIVLNGFSKAFAMTGWRIGYICCSKELMHQVVKLHQYTTICAPIFSQYAAAEGLRVGRGEVEKMRVSYQQRRNLMMKGFADMGLPVTEPEGAFYIFPDIRGTGLSSEDFATELIKRHKVAVVPGNVFGAGGEGFVRCCYATEIGLLKEALKRMAIFIGELKK